MSFGALFETVGTLRDYTQIWNWLLLSFVLATLIEKLANGIKQNYAHKVFATNCIFGLKKFLSQYSYLIIKK